MGFKARLSAPAYTDKNWIHTSKGGYNSCILISGNSVLPNCVGYAWGRFREILGSTPKLSRGNAEIWYGTNDGYSRGKTPRVGAVICWAKGKAGVSSDGAGHVAIVEAVNSDGSIVISQSGYKSSRFWTSKIKKGYALKGYTFQGFIYNPVVSASAPTTSSGYTAGGTYTLQANMKVRTGPGTSYRWKKRSELTASGKSSAQAGTYAVLKTGTRISCLEYKNGWMRIPSGWVCAVQNGRVYIR